MLESLLFFIVLLTSSLTSAVGLGGGLILIGILTNFLPPLSVIPAHAFIQLSSNASRAWLNLDVINWRWLGQFTIGSSIALVCLWPLLNQISGEHFPLFIALYLLTSQWLPDFDNRFRMLNNVFVIGFVQTGMGFFVGATGPLAMGFFNRRGLQRDALIANTAAFMVISHITKIIVFSRLSSEVLAVWPSVLAMVIAAIIGSWLGMKFRRKINEHHFTVMLKWLLSALAFHILGRYFGLY